MTPISCTRCGREGEISFTEIGAWPQLPVGWKATVSQDGMAIYPICSGCQLAEWHPHCRALRADLGSGERIDVEALRRDGSTTVNVEIDGSTESVQVVLRSWDDVNEVDASYCDYVDLTHAWTDDEYPNGTSDMPTGWWTCPECGSTDYDGVHADYAPLGYKRTR